MYSIDLEHVFYWKICNIETIYINIRKEIFYYCVMIIVLNNSFTTIYVLVTFMYLCDFTVHNFSIILFKLRIEARFYKLMDKTKQK